MEYYLSNGAACDKKEDMSNEQREVEAFFEWLRQLQAKHALLPTSPFAKAMAYALEREAGLKVFLEDPAVSLDTNYLERQISIAGRNRSEGASGMCTLFVAQSSGSARCGFRTPASCGLGRGSPPPRSSLS